VAEKERVTEYLKFLIEMLRLVWLTLLGVGGGTVGLLLGELDTRRSIFASVGVIVMVLLAVFIEHLRRQIRKTIEQLREV
jgi:hypothetical protein